MLHYLHTRSCPTTREIFVVLIGALKSSPHMYLFFVFYLRKKTKTEGKQTVGRQPLQMDVWYRLYMDWDEKWRQNDSEQNTLLKREC